jgi:hypothetical protein
MDTYTFSSTSFVLDDEGFLSFWPNSSRARTTIKQEMTKYAQFEQYQVKKYREVIMLDVRVRKRKAGNLFKLDMRTVQEDTGKTNALLETEVMGRLVFGIQVVDRGSTGSTNWHQMRLGQNIDARTYKYDCGAFGCENSTRNTSLSFISKALLPSIQWVSTELEEDHRPSPTNHAHLGSANDTLSPTKHHMIILHSLTFFIVSQPSA